MKKNLLLPLMVSVTLTAASQTLSTEVVVDRNTVPSERHAERPTYIYPATELPPTFLEPLQPEYYTAVTDFDRSYHPLDAPEASHAAVISPYRGYVAAGYFPLLDFGASAGYRLIDTKKLVLGARLQFDSQKYRPYSDDNEFNRQFFADLKAGIDVAYRPAERSTLDAHVQYNFLNERTAFWNPQTVNAVNVSAGWHSVAGKVQYGISAGYSFEKNGATQYRPLRVGREIAVPSINQGDFHFDAAAALPFGKSGAELRLNGEFVNTSGNAGATIGFVGVTPAYFYKSEIFSTHVGVRVDFTSGCDKNRIGVMPDVKIDFKPSSFVGIWAKLGGSSVANPFASIRQESVYQLFTRGFGLSRIPFVVEGGVNIGPFKGFGIELFGGYAKADDWLMDSNSALRPFETVNIDGWHAGARVYARWRFLDASASADFAPSEYDSAWFTRRDRAAAVIDAHLGVTPIRPLNVCVDYRFRNRRKAYTTPLSYLDLRSVNNLGAGASWRFTDAFTVFARFENILSRRYMQIAWEPVRGFAGLVGVEYKF